MPQQFETEPLTRDAREILERATEMAQARNATEVAPVDVLRATLQLPGSLADQEIRAQGVDPRAIAGLLQQDGTGEQIPVRRLLLNASREAQVLGHYQVDSIHLLLAMMYSDSPSTSAALQKAGLTLYDVRQHVQTAAKSAAPSSRNIARAQTSLRRRPWPSLRGVLGVSPVFGGIVAVVAVSGALLWANALPRYVTPLTLLFVVSGWIASLCIHEFGHAVVAYLGGDRSVVGAGYLTLDPLRYVNATMSIVLPIVFLLIGGVALPGGAVYINHSALRTRAWSSAVSAAGPAGTAFCALLVSAVFTLTPVVGNVNFFAALAYLGFFQVLGLVLTLLPAPGLDGFGIIRPWLPYDIQYAAMRYSMLSIFAVFALLWFVPPVRDTFFGTCLQISAGLHIDPLLILLGQSNMRFF